MSDEKAPVVHPRSLEEMRESHNKYRNRFKSPVSVQEETPEAIAYREKLSASVKNDVDFSIESLLKTAVGTSVKSRKSIPYPITFSDAEKLFYTILKNELSVNQKSLIIEDVNEEKISELIKYFIGHKSKLNLNKGIYLYGPVGRGKTVIMVSLMIMCKTIEKKLMAAGKPFTSRAFNLKNSKTIVGEVAETKKAEAAKRYYTGTWCIDDLGAEDAFKLYGNDMNVIGDIMLERYQRYQSSGMLTHATSNTKPGEWNTKYGDRVESRLHEMFNVITLLGNDKRK